MLRCILIRIYLLLLALVIILGCAPDKAKDHDTVIVPGMIEVTSAGKSFLQGANDSDASIRDLEKPAMQSSFTYNYWIDKTEVTQKEFADLMHRQPVMDTSNSGKGDIYPVYNVNWYDAVLFCNEKSKKYGLDTVYSYYSKDTIASGEVSSLTGIAIHYEKDGIRLPNEAEWEYAARTGTSTVPFPGLADTVQAAQYAWYATNSSGKTHPVAQLKVNAFGLYDMAGNVYEWTNDWKGSYVTSGITNSIGAPAHDAYYERVIKGGSFKHAFEYLRPSHRSATYQVSLTTACDFIGFRCVRGVISNPSYCFSDTSVISNPAYATISSLSSIVGTSNAKIVFVNVTGSVRRLCLIDYSKGQSSVYEFSDMNNVYVPTISPDGRFVAFCNKGEMLGGKAKVYVRSLENLTDSAWALGADSAFVPRWWTDELSSDTCIIYTNSAIDNSTSDWNNTKTYKQRMQNGKPVGASDFVRDMRGLPINGSYHDGYTSNRQYVVTGYTKLIMYDVLTSGRVHQLFTDSTNGKGSAGLSGSTQVCNVSISQNRDHPERCMFLDFGSNGQTSTLTNTAYGVHEYIFISEFTGKTIAWYKCPAFENCWDYPEWSNAGNFAVASARNAADDAHAVYILNLTTGTPVKLVEGTELIHPYLWVRPTPNTTTTSLNLDSLGNYSSSPIVTGNLYSLGYKLRMFWKLHNELNVAFIGNSQVLDGIDCHQIRGLTSFNMGYTASGLTSCSSLIRNYIVPHAPKIKVVCMSASIGWMVKSDGEGDNAWATSIVPSVGYQYDLHHNFWKDSLPAGFDSYILEAPYMFPSDEDTLGMAVNTSCSGWGTSNYSGDITWTINTNTYVNNF